MGSWSETTAEGHRVGSQSRITEWDQGVEQDQPWKSAARLAFASVCRTQRECFRLNPSAASDSLASKSVFNTDRRRD